MALRRFTTADEPDLVWAAVSGTPENVKWWVSRSYLEDWLALNPDDQPAREALIYLDGLHAGATAGP